MYDLLIKNARVVDGTGSAEYPADIAVADGKFARIAPGITEPARETLDAKGQYATPGFIDSHRHSDAFVFRPGYGEIQIRQGITTTVNGNCGLSIAPCPPARREEILRYLKPIVGTLPEGVAFDSFAEYLSRVEQVALPINFGMHVGSCTLRIAARGFAEGARLAPEELRTLHRYLEDAIAAGCFGVSLGLAYVPESGYDVEGLVEALAPMAGSGVPLVCHMRGEGRILLGAVEEVIETARRLRAPLHISHYKCVGQVNWGRLLREATALLEKARGEGMRVTVDAYPWTAGSTQLIQVLPPEFLEGGMAKTTARLKDPAERERCIAMLAREDTPFENQVKLLGWENIMVSAVKTAKNRDCEGRRITEIAAMRGKAPVDAALDLLAEEDCEVAMINFIACEEDIEAILKLPYSYIISDSIYPDGGQPHPRQYGTFPKLLAEYVRDRKVLTLPEAIRKFTGAPAEGYGIPNKGFIREGCDADLAVFDLAAIENTADYAAPRGLGKGFSWVFVNGRLANERDTFVNTGAGRVIRRGTPA